MNACNVFDDGCYFGEWVDGNFYDDIREDIPSPLVFNPSISGSNDVEVILTVSFPSTTADPG